MTIHTIRPGIGYGSVQVTNHGSVVGTGSVHVTNQGSVAGQALGPASPAVHDATRSEAQRRDAIASLTLQLQAETKAEREAFIADIAQAVIKARRIALEDHHPVGVRRYAEEVAEALEPKLLGMRALMEREG